MATPKKIGLYFGTFNPIHIGHLIIANHMVEYSDLDELWFVVTPHSPFKKKKTLLDDHHRLELVRLACENFDKLKASDVEFKLPQPNYTALTLAHLSDYYPDYSFSILMGEDNLKGFHKWKNYDVILKHHHIYCYPRINNETTENNLLTHPHVHLIDAPVMEISSTFIRNAIKEGKNVTPYFPHNVWTYLDEMNFYK